MQKSRSIFIKPLLFTSLILAFQSASAINVAQYSDTLGEINLNTISENVYTFDQLDIESIKMSSNDGSKFIALSDGLYQINYSLSYRITDPSGTDARRQVRTFLIKNGIDRLATSHGYARKAGQAENATNNAMFYVQLQKDDYIELYYQGEGSSAGDALSNPGESWIGIQYIEAISGTGQIADGTSCRTILAASPSSADGVYNIDPDGIGPLEASELYCDMTTDGGGWTLISKYSGSQVQACTYSDSAECAVNELNNPVPNANSKLSDAAIYALVDSRLNAVFRAVSPIDDTVIGRTDGGNPFDLIAPGSQYQCRDIDANNWYPYGYSASSEQIGTSRFSTWTTRYSYIGLSDGVTQCGNGTSFGTNYTIAHTTYQWMDAGYTPAPTSPGVFYIR